MIIIIVNEKYWNELTRFIDRYGGIEQRSRINILNMYLKDFMIEEVNPVDYSDEWKKYHILKSRKLFIDTHEIVYTKDSEELEPMKSTWGV